MKFLIVFLFPLSLLAQKFTASEIKGWESQSRKVTIIRDNWGIPHIYGKSDADAVFGLLYAQCEDDFKRVEMNYIEKLGRLSEVNGETDIYDDLLIRMLIDSTEAIQDYNKAAPWLKKLLNAYASAVNYYLYKNPSVKPALINRFKPWYPLLWTDGSIGAISTADVTTTDLKNFFDSTKGNASAVLKVAERQTGSNGFALAPSKTASGNAILYINPHVTFYFRPEVHVVSDEGLHAYGVVTWGQFFVYQGFNEYCGWMHTSSSVDVADTYEEKIITRNNKLFYEYDGKLQPVRSKKIVIRYHSENAILSKSFICYYTNHGPVMAKRNGKWISLRSNNRSLTSLMQSWLRTKAKGFEDYKKVMDLRANTSNNTVFADINGNIAYWHGNYIPIRDTSFNWAHPVDGSTSATAWKGLHPVDRTVHYYNPPSGFIQNCNSTPFTATGALDPARKNFPAYMAPDGENFRGVNAVRVLQNETGFTLNKIIEKGYDRYLSAFALLIPALLNAYDTSLVPSDSLFQQLKEPIALLREWDYQSSATSIATTVAIEWAQKINPAIQRVYIDQGEPDQVELTKMFVAKATPNDLLLPLFITIKQLTLRQGTWKIPWGEINRFQRISGALQQKHDDRQPSLPVPFASALWGMLPSYNSSYFPGTSKRYGVSGNSFICAVEFGKRIIAKSLLAGGESGDPSSGHFNDQAEMYTHGQFKDVLFYKEDVLKYAEKTYHPGE
ncbi:MAG TPA: penicillin acylase family protein [Flavitalea sp.]|nr:penicillin acylase family protein [Flavitalea sp.]